MTDRVDQKTTPERSLHSPDKIIDLQVHSTETSAIPAFYSVLFKLGADRSLLCSALKHFGTAIGIVSLRVYFDATLFFQPLLLLQNTVFFQQIFFLNKK